MLEAVGEDRFVVLLPMFHSFMLTVGVLLPMLIGGSIVLIKTLHPPKNIVMEIIQHRATLSAGGAAILPRPDPQLRRRSICRLRLCISGGAPVAGGDLARIHRPLPHSPAGRLRPERSQPGGFLSRRFTARGRPARLACRFPAWRCPFKTTPAKSSPPGQTGEVCVRGANVMLGYWNQPAATAEAMRHGWLLTGDIGYADADGYFYITDRKKDMLLVNGINVYPREIEEVLYKFPGVQGSRGHRHPRRPQGRATAGLRRRRTKACQLEEKAAAGHSPRERLADYKVPRQSSSSCPPSRTTRPAKSSKPNCAKSRLKSPSGPFAAMTS